MGVYYICQAPLDCLASVGAVEVFISLLCGVSHPGQSYPRITESEGIRGQFFISQSCCRTLWDGITFRDPGAREESLQSMCLVGFFLSVK